MPRVSDLYALGVGQGGLDFVDVLVETDNPVFIDPAAIRSQHGEWAESCRESIRSYFQALLDAIRDDDVPRQQRLVYPLVEPNETHLGVSEGRSKGHSLGSRAKADRLMAELRQSRAVATGMLTDLDDSALFVDGIGRDIISDITTCVIRLHLISYTRQMSEFYGIPMENQVPGPVWDAVASEWRDSDETALPRADDNYLLLVPKSIVRVDLSVNGGKYWRGFLRPYFVDEVLRNANPASGLVRILKDRSMKVRLGELDRQLGTTKEALVENTQLHPEALGAYKADLEGRPTPPPSEDALQSAMGTPPVNVRALLEAVRAVAPGNPGAGAYHRAVAELLRALFDLSLANMRLEQDLHSALKRVDIMFDNVARTGFFRWLSLHWSASELPVECKNYTREVSNPEFDQLAMRFAPDRGRIGILVCRSIENRERAEARARSIAGDQHGWVLLIDDDDLETMVSEYEEHARSGVSGPVEYADLRRQFDALRGL
jgi:hypothetical protein